MPSAALELTTWAEWRAFVFVKVNVVAKRLYQTSAYSTEKSILKTGVEHKKVCQTALQVEIRIRIHAAQKAACCELLLPQFFPPRPRPCPLLRARAGIQIPVASTLKTCGRGGSEGGLPASCSRCCAHGGVVLSGCIFRRRTTPASLQKVLPR